MVDMVFPAFPYLLWGSMAPEVRSEDFLLLLSGWWWWFGAVLRGNTIRGNRPERF